MSATCQALFQALYIHFTLISHNLMKFLFPVRHLRPRVHSWEEGRSLDRSLGSQVRSFTLWEGGPARVHPVHWEVVFRDLMGWSSVWVTQSSQETAAASLEMVESRLNSG